MGENKKENHLNFSEFCLDFGVHLKEQIRLLKKDLFGGKSEKRPKEDQVQLRLVAEDEAGEEEALEEIEAPPNSKTRFLCTGKARFSYQPNGNRFVPSHNGRMDGQTRRALSAAERIAEASHKLCRKLLSENLDRQTIQIISPLVGLNLTKRLVRYSHLRLFPCFPYFYNSIEKEKIQ